MKTTTLFDAYGRAIGEMIHLLVTHQQHTVKYDRLWRLIGKLEAKLRERIGEGAWQLHNAKVRIEERDAKIERQKDAINRLQKQSAARKRYITDVANDYRAYLGWIESRLHAIEERGESVTDLIVAIGEARLVPPWKRHSYRGAKRA